MAILQLSPWNMMACLSNPMLGVINIANANVKNNARQYQHPSNQMFITYAFWQKHVT